MSTILALDSSTDACSVALIHEGVSTHLFELASKSHTQRLLPMVDELLSSAGIRLGDVNAIAYGRGPGSFTGLRICMGVVQGLAFGANLPVIPVSTLRAMARGFMADHPDNLSPILPMLDARMDEVYWGLFDPACVPQVDEAVSKPALVSSEAKVSSLQKRFVAIGPGWHYADLAPLLPECVILDAHPNAKDLVSLAQADLAQGLRQSIMDAEPVYLRNSVSWQKRQRIRPQSL